MASIDELEKTLEAIGAEAATIERSPRSTIEPPRQRASTGGKHALEVLERIGRVTTAEGAGRFVLEETLGEGGMGVVRLGTQVALGRKVAVKTLRPEARSEAATLKLLREAWVTGALEHPNVAPVYDVGLDEEGLPVIVLKRIAGTAWADVMHDPQAISERFGAKDLLEWNLQILSQVCNAVHFAHSRGIVHRDLKPDNVMIGGFGEVYVLDWGIAVSLRDDGSGRFPLASQATEMAGTPCYMAPEMLGERVPRISARTDVYLLGAILHEIVTGQPPHGGANLMAIVSSIIAPPKPLPGRVPDELATIVRRAMDGDPDARFENAEQVRLALQGFLQHRSSMQLADQAAGRLAELGRALANAGAHDDEQRSVIYNLFGECRFGFQQALRSWGGNEPARAGLRDALARMVEYELSSGDAKAATLFLAEIDEPPPELVARVEQARRTKEAELRRIAELERRERDRDPSIGRRTRGFVMLIFATIWVLSPLALSLYDVRRDYLQLTAGSAVLLLLASAVGVWARDSLSKTSLNRRLLLTILFIFIAQMALTIAGLILELPPITIELLYPSVWFCFSGLLTIYLDRRFALVALGNLLCLLISAMYPELRYYTMSAANLLLAAVAIAFWRGTPSPLA